mmetsp:Transcript_48546/g.114616  ORF Transcript_48546/g.114616 Transcript_48546/m.114616 type:complete len:744 (+) Transcript_48546:143-2374(+)
MPKKAKWTDNVIPGALAAIVPAVLGGSPGLMCLPALYAVTLRGKKIFLYFWAAPMVLLVLYLLHTGMAMPLVASDLALAVLPIAIPIALHYAAVKVAIDWRVSSKKELDEFCERVSEFLDEKCYKTKSWPPFLYIKPERVFISLTCILKIVLALAFLVLYLLVLGAPADMYDCAGSTAYLMKVATWGFYAMVFVTEVLFHMAMYLSGNVTSRLAHSFDLPVLQPTYWQWYLIAVYAPTHALWIPLIIECIRTVAVSFFRMQDKDDLVVSPLMSVLDVVHVVGAVSVMGRGCQYPHAMLYHQLCIGANVIFNIVHMRYRKWKTWAEAKRPLHCKIYLPVKHSEIECAERKWQHDAQFPRGGGVVKFPADHPVTKKFGSAIKVTYLPEFNLERTESRPDWDTDPPKFVPFVRKHLIPGEWVCIEVQQAQGVLLADKPMTTGLQGQFREIHAVVDTKGVLAYFGDFHGKLYAAKKYKKDPAGGFDLIEDLSGLESEADLSAAKNRLVRLIKPYFQDCLMQEKAAEFGRAFNRVENLPVRKVEILRACVIEEGWDQDIPSLFLVEQFLDDNSPFRKFNNNDFVPGQQAVQNTPNMFSLFSYFHSEGKLLVCDIQGKKYKFTDPQFHSSERESAEDDDYDEGELRDWLHSDGGMEMMKRVLLGLHEQQALHGLCNRVWPDKMALLSQQVLDWKKDPEFADQVERWAKEARMYQSYFANLNPVLDAGIGTFDDTEEQHFDAMMSKAING